MEIDTDQRLEDIRARYRGLLIPQLLEIQKKKIELEKSMEWARSLQCLQKPARMKKRRRGPDGEYISTVLLVRKAISAWRTDEFVAVSYPWHPSPGENADFGGYDVESLNGQDIVPSEVRNGVWKRVNAYAQRRGGCPIWIDRECIPQEEGNPQKEIAVNSMDIVYSRSKYPLGLLFKPIKSLVDVDLLLNLCKGKFVQPQELRYPKLTPETDLDTASKVIVLLADITSDQWWERAWIFQEDYLSGTRMCLLIPHHISDIGNDARRYFGDIDGELEVNSARFRTNTTLFCLAYLQNCGEGFQDRLSDCERILSRAASYKVLYDYQYPRQAGSSKFRKAMSSAIFTAIGDREITNAEDILPIAANSCGYSVRLDYKRLQATGHSLSLCILTLYLLNGEIVKNDERDETSSSKNIFEYLEAQSLDNFNPPLAVKELTFIKNCRFVNVKLSHSGIETTGLLWRLGRVIETRHFAPIPYFRGKWSPDGLERHQRARLQQLSSRLKKRGHYPLFKDLGDYLKADASRGPSQDIPSRSYMDSMAEEIVEAIDQRKTLQLGCLVGDNPYRGIFVTDSSQESRRNSSYVFTAWEPRKQRDGISWRSNLDNYVSLEVDVIGSPSRRLPQLRTKEWINGLCFFSRTSPQDVVFPWPASLTGRG